MVDLPGRGYSMVPCIDMANHATGGKANALYEKDREGNAVLQLHPGARIQPGDEVAISYVLLHHFRMERKKKRVEYHLLTARRMI